jgi:hypothetical protein
MFSLKQTDTFKHSLEFLHLKLWFCKSHLLGKGDKFQDVYLRHTVFCWTDLTTGPLTQDVINDNSWRSWGKRRNIIKQSASLYTDVSLRVVWFLTSTVYFCFPPLRNLSGRQSQIVGRYFSQRMERYNGRIYIIATVLAIVIQGVWRSVTSHVTWNIVEFILWELTDGSWAPKWCWKYP